MQISGVIFDLDGTLGDTVFVSVEAIVRTLHDLTGQEVSHPEIIAHFGPTEEGILRKYLPEDAWQAGYQRFLEHYERIHHQHQIGAYPGIQQVLDLLNHHRIRQAIVTGKGRDSARISLRYFALDTHFDSLETGWVNGSAKVHGIRQVLQRWQAVPSEILYLGDAPSDIDIARQAGVIPLSAAWGRTADQRALTARQPAAVFAAVGELETWLAQKLNATKGGTHVS